MTTVTSVDSAISALKTTAADKEIIAGYKGSYIDPSLEAIMQNATEAASPDWRALWDDAAKRFRLGQTGTGGVREFLFNDALVDTNFGEEDRKIINPLAKEDSWTWDFDEFT